MTTQSPPSLPISARFLVGVLRFPGTNCDFDTFEAIRNVPGLEPVWIGHIETDLAGMDALILPGGFSYGDYLRTGAVAAQAPVIDAVRSFARDGKPVLGICNGFQILVEARILPGVLLVNTSRSFICEEAPLVVQNNCTPFTSLLSEGNRLSLPIAHQEGRYYLPDKDLKELERRGQVVFRYLQNPNGSANAIAGISNPEGNVVGLMPHPERRSRSTAPGTGGFLIFESLLFSLLHPSAIPSGPAGQSLSPA